ncbi:fungal-specific transcription factor domain-containing protein [Mycena galopus ATCC 62051]|nr:fungal-specific transcription factor domain-containing protein [Mycena galopus ATCC 62051]
MFFEDTNLIPVPAKKRRVQRACDFCRQKRRDGSRSSLKKCSYCIDNQKECVYSGAQPTMKRPRYTESLQARLAVTESLLRELSAQGSEGSNSLSPTQHSEWSLDSPILHRGKASGTDSGSGVGPATELATKNIRAMNTNEGEPQPDDHEQIALVKTMEKLNIQHGKATFLGKSSGAQLLKTALELKVTYAASSGQSQQIRDFRRKEYWGRRPWDIGLQRPRYAFPPSDLLSALVDLYFEYSKFHYPLLHRPSFKRSLANNLHLEDDKFGAIVLSVCAIASRFSDDPRVFDAAEPLNCGWKYFSQISSEPEHLYVTPTLYDIQRHCLAIQFLAAATENGSWTLIGTAIRMAQEVGAHRRQSGPHTVEAELMRRAFWVLLSYDHTVALALGRPCAMQYCDFDIQLPTECDDEYWEHADPAQAFRQPSGKPSQVAFFNSYIRLNNILGFILHFLYSSGKMKASYAAEDPGWDEHIVTEVDSALNKWIEGIPEHLRWDPSRADLVFFKQSAILYCAYYHVQMTAHRGFIPQLRPSTTLPSLAICTNAARSASHVIEAWSQRTKDIPPVILLPALTTTCIVLLLNVWSGKRTGLAAHMNSTITEVHKCMEAIRLLESRWQMAGIYWDIINELASVGQVSLPMRTPAAEATIVSQRKRPHPESDHDVRRVDALEMLEASVGPLALPLGFEDADFMWSGALDETSTLPVYGADFARLPPSPAQPNYPFLAPVPQQTVHTATAGWMPAPNLPPLTFTAAQSHFMIGAMHGAGMGAADVSSIGDSDSMAPWMNAPTSLGVEDWGNYFNVMNQVPPR